jgi:hypothetical protein
MDYYGTVLSSDDDDVSKKPKINKTVYNGQALVVASAGLISCLAVIIKAIVIIVDYRPVVTIQWHNYTVQWDSVVIMAIIAILSIFASLVAAGFSILLYKLCLHLDIM